MLHKGVDVVSKCVFTKEEFYERINEAIQNDFDNGDYLNYDCIGCKHLELTIKKKEKGD